MKMWRNFWTKARKLRQLPMPLTTRALSRSGNNSKKREKKEGRIMNSSIARY